jgi:hypothetical protein
MAAEKTKKNKFDSRQLNFISNWGYWFEVDGKRMIDGEWAIRISWPDGIKGRGSLLYARGKATYPDHGHNFEGVCDSLRIQIAHHQELLEFNWKPGESETSFTWEMTDEQVQTLAKNVR